MSFQKHCPGCFRRKDNASVCPHCGYDESAPRSPLFLPHGVMLAGQYRVGKVLGRPGGFGVTYLGWDVYLQQRVAIKEFLPPEMAARVPNAQHVTVHTAQDRRNFDDGKSMFLREARIVARLDHPNVVRVRAFFNANDTAYMVMDYYDGLGLDSYFTQVRPTLDITAAGPLTQMILDGLAYVHQRGVIHRDIKPHNIYLAAAGRPIVLDFGAAWKAAGNASRSASVILTEGYAPLEQYQREGQLGAWTDVYATGALLYRMLVGDPPPMSIDRISHDDLEQQGWERIPEPVQPVLKKALALRIAERYATASEFKEDLGKALDQVIPAQRGSVAHNNLKLEGLIKNIQIPTSAELRRDTQSSSNRLQLLPDDETTRPLPRLAASDSRDLQRTVRVQDDPPSRITMTLPVGAGSQNIIRASQSAPPRASAPRRLISWTLLALVLIGIGWMIRQSLRPGGTLANVGTPVAVPTMVGISAGTLTRPDGQTLPLPALSMSESEVTVAQFKAFIDATQYRNARWDDNPCEGAVSGASWSSPGYDQPPEYPVVCVSWRDANAYTDWLSRTTGKRYRLPKEDEWEYAAAAGTSSNYWWGNQPSSDHAICGDCGPVRETPKRPFLAASMGKNPFGLYGTAGNVREWTCSPEATAISSDCAARNEEGSRRVRGGAWRDTSLALTTRFRSQLLPDARNLWTGFRVVQEP